MVSLRADNLASLMDQYRVAEMAAQKDLQKVERKVAM